MIGVFDSGSGGLTVLKALRETLPDRRFVYYGDHGNAPYGNRDGDAIYDLTVASLTRLFDLGCSLIVVACNTAAATGLRRLQQTWLPAHYPDRRVIGVVVPMVEAVTGVRWSTGLPASPPAGSTKTVAVFATRYTVESKVFVFEATKRAPHLDIVQQACPRLVRLIESDAPVQVVRRTVRRYVELLLHRLGDRRLDAVLLGCTHYPLIADLFVDALPADVEVLSQPEVTACSLAAYLASHPEFACSHEPGVTLYTSAAPEHVTARTRRFHGDDSVWFAMLN
ncbi:glutamate racemase [Acidovorax sp. LjRoot117]|uniref:glutamate racemase n=1 Tax=Acidovorax sp. LjRoot117 TaxID=3342255 RepID=UPI003ECF7864